MSHAVAEERPVEHGDALNLIRSAISEAPGPDAAAQRAVELLHDRFSHYDWVGVYWVDLTAGPDIAPTDDRGTLRAAVNQGPSVVGKQKPPVLVQPNL